MAEKSILVFEAGTGKKIALRDAAELDDIGEARYIERMDFASGKGPTPKGFQKRGGVYTKAYTSGGTHEVVVGDLLHGHTSAATCRVISLTLTSGTWAGGDAAGTLTVVDKSGVFQAEDLDELTNENVCTIAAGDLAASNLTSADTLDLTALPAELTQNLLTVGDKSLLCVAVEQFTSGGTVTIMPIGYDNESSPGIMTLLQPKNFTQPYAARRGSGSGMYVLPVMTWDVVGVYKIGLHMSAITGASNYPYIYAWVI